MSFPLISPDDLPFGILKFAAAINVRVTVGGLAAGRRATNKVHEGYEIF